MMTTSLLSFALVSVTAVQLDAADNADLRLSIGIKFQPLQTSLDTWVVWHSSDSFYGNLYDTNSRQHLQPCVEFTIYGVLTQEMNVFGAQEPSAMLSHSIWL